MEISFHRVDGKCRIVIDGITDYKITSSAENTTELVVKIDLQKDMVSKGFDEKAFAKLKGYSEKREEVNPMPLSELIRLLENGWVIYDINSLANTDDLKTLILGKLETKAF